MAVSIQRMPVEVRPRERLFQVGLGALSDAELVALVIGSGRRGASAVEVAGELLAELGSLTVLSRARPEELSRISAVGCAKAASLVAAFELGRRAEARTAAPPRIGGPADIAIAVRPHVAEPRQEEVFLVVLGGGNRIRRVVRLACGGSSDCGIRVRDVLTAAFRHGATALALAHSHPSGDPAPSSEDVALTRELRKASDQVGLRLADHVIVAGTRWASLRALGYLDP